MINKFEKQLEKWNGGVLRGAQAKLARLLRVSTATVALWTTGKRRPSKGYAAQMAQLFGIDVYDVMRLFASTTMYPDVQSAHAPRSLRDAQDPSVTYSTDIESDPENETTTPQSNSVSLPFLAAVPASYPEFDESEVVEWWTLPRRYAKGARYLVPCRPTGAHSRVADDDLCLIKPADEFLDGKMMLVKTGDGYIIKRLRKENGKIVLYSDDGAKYKTFSSGELQPVGLVVRRITDVE